MPAPDFAVVADDVTSVERIICRQAGRLKAAGADYRVGTAEHSRQELISGRHLGSVFPHQSISRQNLRTIDADRMCEPDRPVFLALIADYPRLSHAFQMRHPGLRQRLHAMLPIIESHAPPG